MPKMKNRRAATKRFLRTGTGKLKRFLLKEEVEGRR